MHAIDGMACAKRGCDNRENLGLNIVGHGSFPTKWGRRWRYRCTVCGGTVSTNTGTAYSGLRLSVYDWRGMGLEMAQPSGAPGKAPPGAGGGRTVSFAGRRGAVAQCGRHRLFLRPEWIRERDGSSGPRQRRSASTSGCCATSKSLSCRLMSSARSSAPRAEPHGCVRPSRCVPDGGPGACSAAAPLETPRPSSTTSSSADAWWDSR